MSPETATRRQQNKRGIVVSNRMTGTVVVTVDRYKLNRKYSKRYLVTKRYYADTAGKQYQVGEEVELVATRPLSKLKRWSVVKSLGMGRVVMEKAEGDVELKEILGEKETGGAEVKEEPTAEQQQSK